MVIKGADQSPLLDQGDDVDQGGGESVAAVYIELPKHFWAVRLRGCTVLTPPPALYLEA